MLRKLGDLRPCLVVLCACDSAELAEELARCVPCAIGMKGTVRDSALVRFAAALYPALAAGSTLEEAATLAAATSGLGDACCVYPPELAREVRFLTPQAPPPP